MARSDKRYMVYPAPRALEIIGSTSPALNQALECWAAALARATAKNSANFSESYEPESPQHPEWFPFHEWAVLAESIKDKPFDPEFARPGDLLAAAVEDAQRFDNVGCRWFLSEVFEEMPARKFSETVDESINNLADKLRNLDYTRAWAIIVAVQWFWEHHPHVKISDRWWKLAFRREWKRKTSEEAPSRERGKEKKGTKTQAQKRK